MSSDRVASRALPYLACVALSGLGLLGLYIAGLAALDRAGYLPPPPLVNSLCADGKLECLRNNPPAAPTHLIVGSSVAWGDIDGSQIVLGDPAARPLNEGFCAAQMHQSAFVTWFMIERFPSVQTVIAAVEPHDFRNCDKGTEELFPPTDADDYIFKRRWLYGFYLRYFDLHALQSNARKRRAEGRENLDQWGDNPMWGHRSLYYGKFEGYDKACFAALRELATSLKASGRRLIVATTPINPAWSALYDKQGTIMADLADEIGVALAGTDAVFWDGNKEFHTDSEEFLDAVHLQWPTAQRYSAALVASTGLDLSGNVRAAQR